MTASSRVLTASVVGVVTLGLLAWAVLASYHPVRPRLMCSMPLGNGEVAVYFGYTNQLQTAVAVPAGEDNFVSPWARVSVLPTSFAPGATGTYPDAAFVATYRPATAPAGERLSWTLGPRTVSLRDDTPRCPVKEEPRPPDDVVWVKPKPVEIAKVEPEPVVVEPEPIKPPEPVKPPEPPKPEPPKRAEPRPPRPKQAADKPPPPERIEAPVALALTGLTNAPGGMAIQKGDYDSFGSAAVKATPETTRPTVGGTLDGDPNGVGTAPKAEPKRVAARVKTRPKGEWPADAPPRAGAVLVRLSLLVGTDGRVKQVKVVRKAGPAFDREAREVGLRAVFEPATVDGTPVESWVPWDVEFTPDTW